jgi:hypothetical protein
MLEDAEVADYVLGTQNGGLGGGYCGLLRNPYWLLHAEQQHKTSDGEQHFVP